MIKAFMLLVAAVTALTAYKLFREAQRARREHDAELAAHEAYEATSTETPEQIEELRRSKEWQASFNAAIADLDRQFAALVAGLPTSGDDPFDPNYWPDHSDDTIEHALPALAEFDPATALTIIVAANAQPAWFSWTTGHHTTLEPRETPERLTVGSWRRVREPALALTP